METKEQVKHTPYRILNSKEVWAERQMVAKAFTVAVAESIVHEHNCYGELLEALRDCMKDSFTAADGMSQSGKRSFAGERYRKAVTAIAKAEGR